MSVYSNGYPQNLYKIKLFRGIAIAVTQIALCHMHIPRIHIICRKPEIAELINKTLKKSGYTVSSTYGDDINADLIMGMDSEVDCLIFDKDIDAEVKIAAQNRFSNAKVICLPSLESANNIVGDAEYMSEPLKLSELTNFINNMFHVRSR
jgi:hypothetical protein